MNLRSLIGENIKMSDSKWAQKDDEALLQIGLLAFVEWFNAKQAPWKYEINPTMVDEFLNREIK